MSAPPPIATPPDIVMLPLIFIQYVACLRKVMHTVIVFNLYADNTCAASQMPDSNRATNVLGPTLHQAT